MDNNLTKDNHYVGTFSINGQNESGQIIHNHDRGIIVLDITKEIDTFGKFFEASIPVITGKINNGAFVTLFNNKCIRNSTQFSRNNRIRNTDN